MRHIIFEAILAREFTSSSCVSLSELYSAATILELNSKQSHGVHSFPSVVVRGPDFSGAAYQPVICISRFAGHGSTYLAVSLFSRFKDSPFQETDDTVTSLQQCGFSYLYLQVCWTRLYLLGSIPV